MKLLLKKELRLAMHPAALCFLFLSALVLVPNYPYYVTFFYTSLGIFFICLSGRENRDAEFSLLLPMSKGEVVKARFFTAVLLEGLTLILTVPFGVLRQSLSVAPNAVGMEANIAFLGFSLILLGLFNFVFFIGYYKDIQKVGKAFIGGSAAMFLYIVVVEAMTHEVPFFRDRLDTADPLFLWEKLAVLFFGLLFFSILTILAYRISRRNFEKYDLT